MPNSLDFENQETCPLCGDAGKIRHNDLSDRLFQVPGTFGIRACERADCGTLWLDPRPTQDSLGKAYADYYTHSGSQEASFESLPITRKIERIWDDLCWRSHLEAKHGYNLLRPSLKLLKRPLAMLAHLRPSFCADWDLMVRWQSAGRIGRLLDVGCGNGDALHMLSTLGWTVEGTDVDPSSVAVARSRGLTVHHGDLSTLDLETGAYDVVTLSHVIEHVHRPDQLLSQCKKLLKPNGRLVVVTPNVDGLLYGKHRANWLALDPPRHLILFTARSLRSLAGSAGLHNVNVSSSIRSFPMLDYSSQQIGEKGRYQWGDEPDDLVSRTNIVFGERLAAIKVALGLVEGDELVLTANA
jgi:2-polyprenyl-3-methyl-5-hydroxy-6-metoxy-1,4-benzoquinol methylase